MLKWINSFPSYHLAESSDIAAAAVCGWKFRLPRIMGALPRGLQSYIPGALVHKILEKALSDLRNFWISLTPTKDCSYIKDRLLEEWTPLKEMVFNWYRRVYRNIEVWVPVAEDRLERIAETLARQMMELPPPHRILTEVLITNPKKRHEGRIDAILEYDREVITLEWKTYKDSNVSKRDSIQTVANGMLVNYRYGRDDMNFQGNQLRIILPDGAHLTYPTDRRLREIIKAKKYVLNCLQGKPVKTEMPFPAVCKSCGYSDSCSFYRKRPRDFNKLQRRRQAWRARYHVLAERGITHKYDFCAAYIDAKQLEMLGIGAFGFEAVEFNDISSELVLEGPEPKGIFDGDPVRVIGLEGRNISLLGCVSAKGGIREVNGNETKVHVFGGNVRQLMEFPIALLRSEVDLTKADLQAIDLIERRRPDLQPIADILGGMIHEIAAS